MIPLFSEIRRQDRTHVAAENEPVAGFLSGSLKLRRTYVANQGAGTSLPSFTCVNTGLSAGRRLLVTRVGETDLYARVVPTETVLLFR